MTIHNLDNGTHIAIHPKQTVLHRVVTADSAGPRIWYTQQVDTIETATGRIIESRIDCYWHTADGRLAFVS